MEIISKSYLSVSWRPAEAEHTLRTKIKGYTKEVNVISWNGAEPKLNIRAWKPDHNRCMKGLTLTEQEGRELMKALVNLYQEIDKNTKNEP